MKTIIGFFTAITIIMFANFSFSEDLPPVFDKHEYPISMIRALDEAGIVLMERDVFYSLGQTPPFEIATIERDPLFTWAYGEDGFKKFFNLTEEQFKLISRGGITLFTIRYPINSLIGEENVYVSDKTGYILVTKTELREGCKYGTPNKFTSALKNSGGVLIDKNTLEDIREFYAYLNKDTLQLGVYSCFKEISVDVNFYNIGHWEAHINATLNNQHEF